jgi:hypothetical protein
MRNPWLREWCVEVKDDGLEVLGRYKDVCIYLDVVVGSSCCEIIHVDRKLVITSRQRPRRSERGVELRMIEVVIYEGDV